MTKSSQINIVAGKHPVLFKICQETGKQLVPISVQLSHDTNRIIVISGPNAGGKSVAMKTIGLLQYMVQCAFPVPVDETSEFGIFNKLFIDIGDAQSVENDLSTYSSRLRAMKYLVRMPNNRTLVLMDEFGTGTEPQFGGAIAEAVLHRLEKLKAYGVITTHYSNIKEYAEKHSGLINGAMRYDTDKLEPLYQLEIGRPGSSFAFEIARKIGLHPSMLKYAQGKLGATHVDYDKLLTELESDKARYQRLLQELDTREQGLTELKKDYEALRDMLEKEKKQTLATARGEAREIIRQANKQVEQTIREIKESQAEKVRTKTARDRLKKEETRLAASDKSQGQKRNTALKIGDLVRLTGQESVGEVIHISGDQLQVQFGMLTSFIVASRLEKVGHKQAKVVETRHSRVGGLDKKTQLFTTELDVRGKRAEEVIPMVDRFVDDALLVGSRNIRILHGKGYGILRDAIRRHLQEDPNIESLVDEHVERGGSGVTLVTLR